MIRMYEDFNYKQNRNTTYGDQKMVEEFNMRYEPKIIKEECIGCDKVKWLWCDKRRRERNYGKLYNASK